MASIGHRPIRLRDEVNYSSKRTLALDPLVPNRSESGLRRPCRGFVRPEAFAFSPMPRNPLQREEGTASRTQPPR